MSLSFVILAFPMLVFCWIQAS